MSAVFPNKDGSIDVYMQYWVTYDKAIDRKTKNEADYFTWSDQGYVTIVPGNRHDYALIRNQISDINALGCTEPPGLRNSALPRISQPMVSISIHGLPKI